MVRFIGDFLEESRRQNDLYGDSGFHDTCNAITETATKQVLRKVIADGFKSQHHRDQRKTAARIDLDTYSEGKDRLPSCPVGYYYDRKAKDCRPKSQKDSIKVRTEPGGLHTPMFNVWGRTGVNGDGYAWEDDSNISSGGDHAPEVAPMGECKTQGNKKRKAICVRCGLDQCRCLGNQQLADYVLR